MNALFYLVLLCIVCSMQAYMPRIGGKLAAIGQKTSPTSLYAKKPVETKEEGEYWQGEWVCADCGYVYDKDLDGGGKYFEQQGRGFICPQCSAPRKRYAKKVGDQWGVTRDGGDLPIYFFTFLGLGLVTWFALVYVPTM